MNAPSELQSFPCVLRVWTPSADFHACASPFPVGALLFPTESNAEFGVFESATLLHVIERLNPLRRRGQKLPVEEFYGE